MQADQTGSAAPQPARPANQNHEPALNVPPFVAALALAMIAIHAIRSQLLNDDQNIWSLLLFAFIPARFGVMSADYPVALAALWTPLTYAFLHADWVHLAMNLLWLAAFGSPLARRIGTLRMALFTMLTAVSGAALHLAFFTGDGVPMIGASAIVSGCMGAAARFAFQPNLRVNFRGGLNVDGPALTLVQSFSDARFLGFVGVWLALNLLFGTGFVALGEEPRSIAWQAHVGGFLAGLLCFSLFDPKPQAIA